MPSNIAPVSNVPLLQDFVLNYQQKTRKLASMFVLPQLDVAEYNGRYLSFDIADAMKVLNTLSSPGQPARTRNIKNVQVPFSMQKFHLAGHIEEIYMRAGNRNYDLEMQHTRQTTKDIYRDLDLRIKDQVTNVDNYPSTNKIDLSATPTAQFNDYINSHPYRFIESKKPVVLEKPNRGLLGARVAAFLRQHPDTQKFVNTGTSGSPALVPNETLAMLLGLEEVFVADAQYNPGTTTAGSMEYMWPADDMLLFYAETDAPSTDSVTYGYTLLYDAENDPYAGELFTGVRKGVRVKIFQKPDVDGYFVEPQLYCFPKIATYKCSYYIKYATNPAADLGGAAE